MASAFITVQSCWCAFSPKLQILSNPFASSHVSTFSLPKSRLSLKLKYLSRAASEGTPAELVEDSKFVPLNADDPTYGPPALLLLGFEVEEVVKAKWEVPHFEVPKKRLFISSTIQQLLKELEGEFLEIIFGTEDMITRSLWEAMNTKQPNLEASKIAKSLPRICFFSGLTGEEMIMFIDAFPEFGLEPAVFAALVPNSADKPLQEVIEEIMGDHEMMSSRQLD